MKQPIFWAVLLLLPVSAALAQQSFKLSPPDRSFAVRFPGEPRHEQNISDSGPVHVEAHSYSWENSEAKFILTYFHLTPPPVDLKAADALQSAISGTLENARGKLVAQESLTMSGSPARAVKISVGDKTVIDGRFVYVNPRVYQLLVRHKKDVQPDFEQQFFDSFTVRK
jgi:hypothetical protein